MMYFSIQDNEGNWLESGSNSIRKRDAINGALELQLEQLDSTDDRIRLEETIEELSDDDAEFFMQANFGLYVVLHEVKNLDYDFDNDTY